MSATPTSPHGGADAPINLWNLGRVRILQALTQQRSLSRAELVQRTGLARATVGSVVYDLIDAGVVHESANTGPTGARTGRPPQMLSLAPEAGYAIGIDVGHDHVRATLTDLVGAPRWDRSVALVVDDDPEHALCTAVDLTEAAIAETEVARAKILGLGLGIACPVDASSGELHAEDIMAGWVGVRPTDELADRTGLPVQIINDANAGALAERRFGAARAVGNVVYLRLSSGIGAGVVSDGRMLLGHDGLAGELGHVTVEPQGTLCRCGNRGCLETVASPTAIAELLSRGRGEPVHGSDIEALLAAGDRGTLRAVEDAGEAVGRALAMTVMLLNPELIVVGGDLVSAGEALFEPMRRTIGRTIMRAQQNALRIVPGALGDSAGVLGAAALVLDTVPERLGVAV